MSCSTPTPRVTLLAMAVKYKSYFQNMVTENQALFGRFKGIHDLYQKDKKTHQTAFNEEGKIIVAIIRDWEKKLCGHMEKGDNAVYSARLAEKFWNEVRSLFPLIDFVGAEIKK